MANYTVPPQVNVPPGKRRGFMLSHFGDGDLLVASLDGRGGRAHVWLNDEAGANLVDQQFVLDNTKKQGVACPKAAAVAAVENNGSYPIVVAFVPKA